ncbi:hypothetical protein BT67DRAFT_443146 [Trichocladium antarcticum]|uniref:Aminoglycoside phosphotransferase domain-containing protein n=1 Tax=Trichocladium antarcticum TaxID=1450529 RepID=A0AAN6UI26_9PEZI|nr:hypothetical protein BT67DRAFT_443146 [Trichocladium antarcticum]
MAAGGGRPGPFWSVAAFHNYFVSTAAAVSQNRQAGPSSQVRWNPQHLFPADVPIVFTHGALHPRNIIVSTGPNPRVVSIIGWEQAGWYPAYWELCKARWECARGGPLDEWEGRYLPQVLNVDELGAVLRDWNIGSLCQYWGYFMSLISG